ncbi:tetratricopeptide repeat protein [Pseudomonas citronellolis]|uniref:tetratricopeptide repeat protein n=1 Tax=Pseudomonas citronellolis TaxID=53408 RepID=UPI00078D25BD|nr:tetratricopeptide repeat protein [Pseudomonas citronellolis]AMO76531.1 Tetratricopeptide repeat protein [Pseudomonas citronellolis]
MEILELKSSLNDLNSLRNSSVASMALLIAGGVFLLGSIYYSATKLTPLEKQVIALKAQEEKLRESNEHLLAYAKSKELELKESESMLAAAQNDLKKAQGSLDYLQEGMRFLQNGQYSNATESFKKYLDIFPDSTEALNLTGYSELRLALFSQKSAENPKTAKEKIPKLKETQEKSFKSAKAHFEKAIDIDKSYVWPRYNLSILYFQNSMKDEAISELSKLLNENPEMTKWICEDGQFRKFNIDKDTSKRFSEVVSNALIKLNISDCWVLKPVKAGV